MPLTRGGETHGQPARAVNHWHSGGGSAQARDGKRQGSPRSRANAGHGQARAERRWAHERTRERAACSGGRSAQACDAEGYEGGA